MDSPIDMMLFYLALAIVCFLVSIAISASPETLEPPVQLVLPNNSADAAEIEDDDLIGDGHADEEENDVLHADPQVPIHDSQSNVSPAGSVDSGHQAAGSNVTVEGRELCIHGHPRPVQEQAQEPRQCSMGDLVINPTSLSPWMCTSAQPQAVSTEEASRGGSAALSHYDGSSMVRPPQKITESDPEASTSLVNGQATEGNIVPVSIVVSKEEKPPPGRSRRPDDLQTSSQSVPGDTPPEDIEEEEGEARDSGGEAPDESTQRNVPPERDRPPP